MADNVIEKNEQFYAQLMRHEGAKRAPDGSHIAYRCPAGALTIGYGHNLDALPLPGLDGLSCISEEQARQILREDAAAVTAILDEELPWWRSLNAPRQAVLLNMAFNMGVGKRAGVNERGERVPGKGLLGFENTLRAVREMRWKDARDGMLASKWAGQVGRRAPELAAQMMTGDWQG